MESFIYALWTEEKAQEAVRLFGAGSLQLISTSESFVYSGLQGEKEIILRVTHISHRSELHIQGELAWMEHLLQSDVSVSPPLRSIYGNYVERLGGGESCFFVAAFAKAPGRHPQPADWGIDLFREWGRTVGAMHKAAAAYELGVKDRPSWDEEYNISAISDVLAADPQLIVKQQALLAYLHKLPQDRKSFGMIHSDFEDENFFVHQGMIHPFDFDECQYHWFAYDIGNAVRAASWILPAAAPSYTLEEFTLHFLEGYRQEHPLDAFWIQELPAFIRLRELCIYVYVHGKRDVAAMSAEEQAYIQMMRRNIVQEVSCVSLDFAKLARIYEEC